MVENERCDQLAMAALRLPNLPTDDGYENKPEAGLRPDMQEGDPCRKCSTPVIKQTSRKKRNRDYYIGTTFCAPKCETTYQVEIGQFARSNRPPSL